MDKILPVMILLIVAVFLVSLISDYNHHDALIDYDITSIEYIEPFNEGRFTISDKDVKYLEPYLKNIYVI